MGTAARQRTSALRSASPVTEGETIEVASASVEVVSDKEMRIFDLEHRINSGMSLVKDGWREVWLAVAEIRRDRLFESAGYKTLVDFCFDKFGWQKSHVYEIANAGQVASGLLDAGVDAENVPVYASQVNALLPVNELDRPEVLKQAIDRTEGKLTAEAITEAVNEYLGKSESGKTFEELQELYKTIPAELTKFKAGKFTRYRVLRTGAQVVHQSLQEVEDYFEEHKQKHAEFIASAKNNTTQVTTFNGSSPAFDRPSDRPADAPPEQTSRLQDYNDRDVEVTVVETIETTELVTGGAVETQPIVTVEESIGETIEAQETAVVEAIEDESDDEEFEGSSFDCYTALKNVVRRFSALQGLGWGEVSIGNAADYLYGELTGMVQ